MKRITFLVALLFINILAIYAQKPRIQLKSYPQHYFRPPLDLAPQAAGSFGELRANHFHSGTDYRTNQREGYPVYAAADGFISRARVQIGGGGNALYIDHPNGYTSVYMHLQRFNDKVTAFVKNKQYEEERFDVDFPLPAFSIPVRKGEIIAYSGSTGAVAGPHVHFELRDTKTEHPINTQLFGLTIPDRVPPVISGLTVYRLANKDYSEETPREHLQIVGSKGHYRLSSIKPIIVNGNTGFGIVAIDQNSASANRNGLYAIELSLDGTPIYAAVWENFSFDNSRAINAHIDYATYILHKKRIQKSFVEAGNQLEIYQKLVNNGIINIKDGKIHQLIYHVSDVMGNTSTLSFSIQNDRNYAIDEPTSKVNAYFPYDKDNTFTNEQVRINIPKGNLYSSLSFKYAQGPLSKNGYSYVYHIHNRMVPVHKGYTLAIKAERLPAYLQPKAIIVSTPGGSQGGTYEDGYVSTTARTFGSFYIDVDTVAPIIRSLNLMANKNMAGYRRINFRISDNLSGIQSFNGYIDGQWVLMGYDPKTAKIWHIFESELTTGKHHFKLMVKDWKNNEQTFEADFLR